MEEVIIPRKIPIEANNTLFLQGSEILKFENSMLVKNQNGADHGIHMVNNTEFLPPFHFSPALNSQIYSEPCKKMVLFVSLRTLIPRLFNVGISLTAFCKKTNI